MNYISGYDFVPFFDPFGYIEAKNSGNITFLPSGKNPIYDHCWSGGPHNTVYTDLCNDINEKIGNRK